jgi:hypothetical protein
MARTKPIHTTSHYKRVHKWLIRNYKKSRKCAFCHKTSGKFEWALLKGCSYEKKNRGDPEMFKKSSAACYAWLFGKKIIKGRQR